MALSNVRAKPPLVNAARDHLFNPSPPNAAVSLNIFENDVTLLVSKAPRFESKSFAPKKAESIEVTLLVFHTPTPVPTKAFASVNVSCRDKRLLVSH